MNVIFGVALAALIIGSVLIQHWPAIAALSGGSAAFLGALVGAAAGLGAILAGALYNAKLNRDENKRLRDEHRIAVAVEVQADMVALAVHAETARGVISDYRGRGRPMGVGDLVSFELPRREFLQGAPGQLGVLGPDLCFEIATAHIWLANIRQSFAALRLLDSPPPLDAQALKSHETNFVELASACERAIDALEAVTGRSIARKEPTEAATQ